MVDIVAVVDRAPEPLRRLVYRIAAGQGLAGRTADALRFRFSDADIPALPPVAATPVRLLIGPTNSAGQGFRWARAAEQHLLGVTATALLGVGGGPFRADVDVSVPVAVFQRSEVWHTALEAYLERQTHVVWESGQPLLGRAMGSEPSVELRRLEGAGVHGALMFHGSDIRPPGAHAAASPWSPFREASGRTRALAQVAAANAERAASLGVPVFVSTPDLLRWQPDAVWCPVVVDVDAWAQPEPSVRPVGEVPVVVHAPSQRWLKGTDRFEKMLRRLDAEGVIAYREVTGVPHAAMPEFYRGADIVLDQFVLGIYGVAACEAMAAGRLVISHVDALTRATVEERTGLELPVHEATLETLEAELRRAVADPGAFERERAAGPAFVAAVHDGRRSAQALAPFLGASA